MWSSCSNSLWVHVTVLPALGPAPVQHFCSSLRGTHHGGLSPRDRCVMHPQNSVLVPTEQRGLWGRCLPYPHPGTMNPGLHPCPPTLCPSPICWEVTSVLGCTMHNPAEMATSSKWQMRSSNGASTGATRLAWKGQTSIELHPHSELETTRFQPCQVQTCSPGLGDGQRAGMHEEAQGSHPSTVWFHEH